MAAHLAPTDRRRTRRALLIALGIGLLAVVAVETNRDDGDSTSDRSDTSSPTVLGATVTRPSTPRAEPATPATFDPPGGTTASTLAPPRPAASTSTTEPAEIIDPVTVENTTTTTSSSSSSTAPEPSTSTTDAESTPTTGG